jgi:DNA-binding transcriptional regulator YhcF (GntR family)
MRRELKKARVQQLDRMLRAMREHNSNPPSLVTRTYVNALAARHLVNPKTMQRAFHCLLELEDMRKWAKRTHYRAPKSAK